MQYSKVFVRFNWITLIFIYLIVVAGSFVRISGSGMGCPDWPKCFGQWVPPTEADQLPSDYRELYLEKRTGKIEKFSRFLESIGLKETASALMGDPSLLKEEPFNARKTWTEYINRLFGFVAGNLMLIGFLWILLKYRKERILRLSAINLILMGIEAWFGSIVVASNLVPWTITIHMLLALIIIALQIYIIHIISPLENRKIILNKTMKVLTFVVFFITFYQMILGTQVREYVDELARAGFSREVWTDKIGWSFFIHRSFSWLVLILMTYMVWRNEKEGKLWIIRSAYIILALELTGGVLLAYADMPGFVQISHLVCASLLFGILIMLVFRTTRSFSA
jgi:cytochrome c oxidase assembly protein subunit 15